MWAAWRGNQLGRGRVTRLSYPPVGRVRGGWGSQLDCGRLVHLSLTRLLVVWALGEGASWNVGGWFVSYPPVGDVGTGRGSQLECKWLARLSLISPLVAWPSGLRTSWNVGGWLVFLLPACW